MGSREDAKSLELKIMIQLDIDRLREQIHVDVVDDRSCKFYGGVRAKYTAPSIIGLRVFYASSIQSLEILLIVESS